jgi:zinc D-Ala-D-Ala carboxypeptidase
MTPNRKLSKNFSLHEMLVSETAARFSFMEQFEPSQAVIDNLEQLCIKILQPLRNGVKSPIHINSGYRCPRVNSSIGGASKSQHLTGHAADINDFQNGNEFLLRKIIELKLPFDQVINEFNFRWIHISFDPAKNRRQMLEAVKDKNHRTVYKTMRVD